MNRKERVEIIIEETLGVNRVGEPVTVGVPFPKGLLSDKDRLYLFDTEDKPLPLQTQTLMTWPDHSMKWVLLDFPADCSPNSTSSYHLKFEGPMLGLDVYGDKIKITESGSFLSIDTGKALFSMNRKTFSPFESVVVSGVEMLDAQNSFVTLRGGNKKDFYPVIKKMDVETTGGLRSTIMIEGHFESEGQNVFCDFITRLHFYAGKSIVRIEFTIRNPKAAKHPGGLWDLGDEGSVYFKNLLFKFALSEERDVLIFWKPEINETVRPLHGNKIEIYQDSSGGEKWDSPNHVNRYGKATNSFRGYKVTADRLLEEGHRATPSITIASSGKSMSAAIQKFWQNSPKTIKADDNQLTLELFPDRYIDIFELQGGEQKTHVMYIEFGSDASQEISLDWIEMPLFASAKPEWYAGSRALGYMSPKINSNTEYENLVENVISGDRSFFVLRENIDEYGWRHFGEVYAEHEIAGYKGTRRPFISHYNNQYDIINGCLLQFARTGDMRWYQLMSDLAKHVMDIDVYHTKEDRPGYNGGYFWHTDHFMHAETSTHRSYSKANANNEGINSYGGGPSPEHCYTTGLAMYYYITGDVMAKETVIMLAGWIMNEKRVQKSIVGILRKVKQMLFAYFDEYSKAPGRAEANSVNTLLDAFELSSDRKYLVRSENIINEFMGPSDDIDKLNKQKIERRWFYLIFLQSVGKYLDIKDGMNERDKMFNYAKDSLMHHAKWMLENEVPYKQLFHLVEIPSSTWPAHDIRKSVIFDFAYKYGEDHLKGEFKAKADYFYNKSIEDIMSFKDGSETFARPLAILMNYGVMHTYFQNMHEERLSINAET